MFLKKITTFSLLTVTSATIPLYAQTIRIEPVEVMYGNQIFHGEHQVVLSSPEDVTIIPAEQPKNNMLANLVVSANPNKLSYLEESAIAKREQEIYREVNQRTKDSPFTVLFTGHIPEEIQQKRLSMMPEIGIFGDQKAKLEQDQAALHPEDNPTLDEGEFTEVVPGTRIQPTAEKSQAPAESVPANQAELTNEQKLEQLIGG
ncbi:hypothetical protein [Marinomonas fungiae]|uniref:Uncharacterized protein n=1 Tax=Marinomonas fungiae TaxID=1137284 RepID=A0A0K6IG96_9GAMM|nr:hypothetical protein [Marinomonas fungiae]CUB02397.1 hypothetical protein Ga0061065_101230 [Marinomonas fungiae]